MSSVSRPETGHNAAAPAFTHTYAGVDRERRWADGTTPLSKPEFASWLRERIEDRDPAAVVRFGDAEARLLTTEPDDAAAVDATAQKLKRETGLSFSPASVSELKASMDFAYDEAEVLGIRFVRAFLQGHKEWMAKLFDLYRERVAAGRCPAILAHCMLGHDILDELPSLLTGRRVSVISCRNVRSVLESDWGLSDVAVYQVPSQYATRDVDGAYEASLHEAAIWPDVHAAIKAEMVVRERGEVFLVGAGLFGKDLCIRIREQGGIALDMGSALDRVAGKITRGPRRRALDLYADGHSEETIATWLHRLYGIKIGVDKVASVTGKALDDAVEWNGRQLDAVLPVIHFDRLQIDVGERANMFLIAIGVGGDGAHELLGIWRRDDPPAKPWLKPLDDLRRRGVGDVLIACVDDVDDLSDAVEAAFPLARLHTRGGLGPALADTLRPLVADNAIPAMHATIRGAIDTRGCFPDDRTAIGVAQLAYLRAESSRERVRPWEPVRHALESQFSDRFPG